MGNNQTVFDRFKYDFFNSIHLWISYSKKIRGIKEPELRTTNLWIKVEGYKDFEIWTFAVEDENENERLLNSLDFPDWEIIDPFRFILKIKTVPDLELLNGSYFDENMLETEKGIFIIRINKKGFGMTLCFLDAFNQNFIEVTKLKSLSWEIKYRNNALIELEGYDKREKHIVQIKILQQ